VTANRRLVTATAINSVGDGAFYVTSVLFLTRVAGLAATQVGIALTVGWAAGFLASTPLGALADRCGLRPAAALLAAGTAVALVGLLPVRSLLALTVVAILYGCCQSGLGAVRQAMLAVLTEPGQRTTARGRLQVAQNAGLAVGAAAGGIALALDIPVGYAAVLVVDAIAFLAAAAVLATLPLSTRTPRLPGHRLQVLHDRPYAVLAGLNAVMLLYMPLLSVVLPLWVVAHTMAPPWLVSALFIFNTVAVMLGQVHVAQRVRTLPAAGRAVRLAGGIMLASCAAFAWSGHLDSTGPVVVALVLAAALQVAAELLSAAGSWQVAFDLAPDDQQGQYQGLYAAGVPWPAPSAQPCSPPS